MKLFESANFDHHESVSFFDDKASGLKAIIAIHSTALGPACGGTRMYAYANEGAALTDVLRLSRGMSYKNAIADLPLGGGKAVIIGDPLKDKSEKLFTAYGRAIDSLGGRYITAMDVGVLPPDMPIIARATRHAAGFDQPGKPAGDSGPPTALGVFVGLKAAIRRRLGVDTAKGLKIAIQGLGKVGMNLGQRLHEEGASLIVSDVQSDNLKKAVERFGAKAVSTDEIVTAECDVFSPNALGAILNDKTVPKIHAKVVAGAANNQLERDEHGQALKAREILYAPDYVINGGGIIRVAGQVFNWSDAEVSRRVLGIADTLDRIFRRADSENAATSLIADRMAQERIATAHMSAAAE